MRGRACRLVVALTALLLLAGAAAGEPGDEQRKQQLDAQVAQLRNEISQASQKEGVLTDQLSSVTASLREAQATVDAQQHVLSGLEGQLVAARARLAAATAELARRTEFLRFQHRQEAIAERRLEDRLREIYKHGTPDVVAVFVSATSVSQLLDDVDYVRRIGRQDRHLAASARRARAEAAVARKTAASTRAAVAKAEHVLAERTSDARGVRDRLAASRDTLAAARSVKAEALANVREGKQEYLSEVNSLLAQSNALAARIRAAQTSGYEPPVTGSGQLQWPVSGPVTSGFGMRWGRMHEGIDIAVPYGTPVHAAAAGRVIYAGWMGGYGNLVVLDNGNGISTAYGHNTSVSVSVGQEVATGDVIASSGSTGHSTGPHVHFEVRVNGSPVDPLQYL
jgi:murein DD-endopeptidase MepM/ murein hydrolase activator NlpD